MDNAVYPKVYKPADHWSRYVGSEFKISVVKKEESIPKVNGFSHIIISGSEASITKPDPWVYTQMELIREAVSMGIPLLGSCHGHQMIAAALAGFETVRASKTPEFGWFQLEIIKEDKIFTNFAQPVWSFCVHWDEVHSLPDEFKVLAKSEDCGIQVFTLRSAPVYGIQAHPEMTPAEGEQLITDFLPLFPRMKKLMIKRPARDSGLVKTIMQNFLAF